MKFSFQQIICAFVISCGSFAFAANDTITFPINKCWSVDATQAKQYSAPAKICVNTIEVFAESDNIGAKLTGSPFAGKYPITAFSKDESTIVSITLQDAEYGLSGQCGLFGHTEILLLLTLDENLQLVKPDAFELKSRADFITDSCKSPKWETLNLGYKIK